MTPKVLLSEKRVNIMLNRLCCQLIERHGDFSNTVLVGLQPRGVLLLDQLILLLNENGVSSIQKGKLDTTFFRDDFRRSEVPHNAKGRSIRSALTAIDSYGRPESIELLVLVDRRFSRHLPIQPDYLGAQIDALQGDKVKVVWSEGTANNIVYLEKQNQ
jgi:pyrimidine operon attenuation protein / uracil phosphoribosyltransferase